ncbi:VCBS domain-containing protein [Psychrosphaera algicola]|uniref:VCBS domain-containing protein n=4 Tax=Psychrosphaera TaxID=907197 RepID=A0ABT5FJ26_9GAMM|nr:VCBS domain-containing protein [Psychrosphaera sp. G1-22]MDC2891189.1 VCBS domain-containing protein [Psychrosphaera sp. G1-22]
MKKLFAMSVIALAVAGCSDDTTSEKVGNSFGQVTLSGTALVGETLTAAVSDVNGVDAANITYTWMAGDVVISGATSETLVLTEDLATAEITVTVSYTDNDNFSEVIKSNETDPVIGLTTPASFSGDRSAVVKNNITDVVMGTVVVTDNDEGEAVLEAQTDVVAMYGTFSIATTGEWTYALDTSNSTISSLDGESDTVTDTLTITSADGTTSSVMVTITGVSNVAVTTKVAKITDSMTDDAGELRYKLSDAISEGKLTVSFFKDDKAETSDGTAKDAYIGLYGESTSTSNAIIDLRIQSDKFVIRDQDDIDVSIPFTP